MTSDRGTSVSKNAVLANAVSGALGSILTLLILYFFNTLSSIDLTSTAFSSLMDQYHKNSMSRELDGVGFNTNLISPENAIFVVATCGGDNEKLHLSGFVDLSKGRTAVAQESGSDRLSISFIVPPKTAYRIEVVGQDEKTFRGNTCSVLAWKI